LLRKKLVKLFMELHIHGLWLLLYCTHCLETILKWPS